MMIKFTVLGEPASKANSRRAVVISGRPSFIKSAKAMRYRDLFLNQCPKMNELIEDDIRVEMRIYYASRRPDLDESLILDLMQDRIYKNDRQVKQKLITWDLDRENPRTIIRICPIEYHDLI